MLHKPFLFAPILKPGFTPIHLECNGFQTSKQEEHQPILK